MTDTLPNLAGVATQDKVQSIGTGKYSADYINWSRTLGLLREHAPGWMPVTQPAPDGGVLHRAPVGGYLLIGFRHTDGQQTEYAAQAVMDNRNNAIPFEKITARDISDTQRRGVCMAAAYFFGLAYELWAKQPLETGYANTDGGGRITDEQSATITTMADDLDDASRAKFLGWLGEQYKIETIADIPPSAFETVRAMLAAKLAKQKKGEA